MIDYDYEPKDTSPYLKLTSKGDKARIRLASRPIHFQETFTDKVTGKETVNERFAWVVIDKTNRDNLNVKAFKSGVMVYKKIKELALDPEWGDPTKYDIGIERTEESGNYYRLIASPNKSDLTDDEQRMVDEANLDLEKLFDATDQGTSTFAEEPPGIPDTLSPDAHSSDPSDIAF